MTYKIKTFKESELALFPGQIIAVLKSEEKEELTGYSGSIGINPIYKTVWVITCLVKE